MSGESSEPDTSLNEDMELTELCQKSNSNSDSESNPTTSCRLPVATNEIPSGEVNVSAISFINARDIYNPSLNISQSNLGFLEGIPFKTLVMITTRKASSRDSLRPSTEDGLLQNTHQGPSIPKSSSLNTSKELETGRIQSLDTLDKPSNKVTLSVKTLDKHSTSRVSSSDTLDEHAIRRRSTVNIRNEHLTCRTSPLNTMDEPSTSRISPENPLERPSTSRNSSGGLISSYDPLEGPSTRTDNTCGSMESSQTCVAEANIDEQIEEVLTNERNGYSSLASAWLKNFLIRHSRQIRHSVLYPWFIALLMILPYSAGYMSCMNLQLCIGSPNLPSMLYLLAITGMLTLITHLATVLSMRFLIPPLTGQELNFCMRVTRFKLFLILILEMCVVFTFKPVFIAPHKDFCPEVFYNYAYYAPFVVLLVTLLLLLINIPRRFDTAENL